MVKIAKGRSDFIRWTGNFMMQQPKNVDDWTECDCAVECAVLFIVCLKYFTWRFIPDIVNDQNLQRFCFTRSSSKLNKSCTTLLVPSPVFWSVKYVKSFYVFQKKVVNLLAGKTSLNLRTVFRVLCLAARYFLLPHLSPKVTTFNASFLWGQTVVEPNQL